MAQMHAEQPATTYAEFKREILNEIARCLNMPFNVAAGNSSGYNYASGRLDHQTYFKSIRVEQSQMARTILDRILYAWLREAILIEGYLPNSLRTSTRRSSINGSGTDMSMSTQPKKPMPRKSASPIIRQLWPMNTRGRGVIGRRNLNNARKRSRSCVSSDSRPIQLHFLQEM